MSLIIVFLSIFWLLLLLLTIKVFWPEASHGTQG